MRIPSLLLGIAFLLSIVSVPARAGGQCEGENCCVVGDCCVYDLGRKCAEGESCECYFKCPSYGGPGGSCGCSCESGGGHAVEFDGAPEGFDIGPAIAGDRIGIKVCKNGMEFSRVASRLEQLTRWEVRFDPSFATRRAHGDWRGELFDAVDRIAAAYGLFVKTDRSRRVFEFVSTPPRP